jgi:ribonuclease HII
VAYLPIPTFEEEKILQAQGYRLIAGVDEVGRGALAGPVAAAAVILPSRLRAPWLKQVRDSKLLDPPKREKLSQYIHRVAISIGIGMVSHEVIDRQGIVRATYRAMRLAISQLSPPPEALLIDYLHLPGTRLPQKGVTDGDSLCISIACASIVAKVARDRLMVELDDTYHSYGLAQHKGYGTEEHLACLQRLGPCPIHRRSFSPVKEMVQRK